MLTGFNLPKWTFQVVLHLACLLLFPSVCHTKRLQSVQKWSERVVFLTCKLRHVLPGKKQRVFFSTCECSLVVRMCGVFNTVLPAAEVFTFFVQSPTPGQCVCLQAKMNVITPPHPTQPKPDPRSVRVFASEDERYYPTPPHPTKARPHLACVCKRR